MFICNKCLEKGYENHGISMSSRGNCEVCEKYEPCYDIPSSKLIPKQPIKPMEKTLKMSVETAREIYKDYNFCVEIKAEISLGLSAMYKMVMENFTKEELEPKKGFKLEDLGNSYQIGYWIDYDTKNGLSAFRGQSGVHPVFKTEKQALSALAFAQLTHVVSRYNEAKDWHSGPHRKYLYYETYLEQHTNGELKLNYAAAQTNIDKLLELGVKFKRAEDAKTSLEVNRELWEQYWML